MEVHAVFAMVVAVFTSAVHGHGRLIEPPSRATAWRCARPHFLANITRVPRFTSVQRIFQSKNTLRNFIETSCERNTLN